MLQTGGVHLLFDDADLSLGHGHFDRRERIIDGNCRTGFSVFDDDRHKIANGRQPAIGRFQSRAAREQAFRVRMLRLAENLQHRPVFHLLAFEHFGNNIMAHGREWKKVYGGLLDQFLQQKIFKY